MLAYFQTDVLSRYLLTCPNGFRIHAVHSIIRTRMVSRKGERIQRLKKKNGDPLFHVQFHGSWYSLSQIRISTFLQAKIFRGAHLKQKISISNLNLFSVAYRSFAPAPKQVTVGSTDIFNETKINNSLRSSYRRHFGGRWQTRTIKTKGRGELSHARSLW